MNKDEALRLASVVLEHCYGHHAVNDDMIEQTAKVIQAALEAKDEPVQVSPLQFVEMVMEKEHLVGKPIFWAEWPNKEKNT
jgi:hypothetical protein